MVSIIIPMYNAEKYISNCIASIETQTYKDIEIVVINDGSTDNSKSVCEKLCNTYSNIKLITVPNGGVSKARNIGLNHATGVYVQFIDADDTVEPNYTEIMVKKIEEKKVDLIVSGYNEIENGQTNVISCERCLFVYGDSFFQKLYLTNRLLNSPSNKLFKRNMIQFGFPNDLALGEDLVFCLKYIEHCHNCYFESTPLYNYISRGGSLSTKFGNEKLGQLVLLDKYCCTEFDLGVCYRKIFIENIYDLFCVMSKDRNLGVKDRIYFVNILCESDYIKTRLKQKVRNENIKYRLFGYFIIKKSKIFLLLLARIIAVKNNSSNIHFLEEGERNACK